MTMILILGRSNFAGILGPVNMSWDTPVDEWRKVIEVNQIGVWICTKLELKQMLKQDSLTVYVDIYCHFAPTPNSSEVGMCFFSLTMPKPARKAAFHRTALS